MEGLLHLFDFHNNNIARKVFAQKSSDEDLEAPRNSFELQFENFRTYRDKKDTPRNFGFEEEWYERSCFPIEASMKKHINDELSKRSNDKQNAPSIVAKLMGVDALPLEAKSIIWLNHTKEDSREIKTSEKGRRNRRKRRSSVACPATEMQQMETESVYRERLEKPKHREHPQEEELQKFKKEFEAWQAARFKECSRIVDVGNNKKLPLSHTDHREAEVLKYSKKHRESNLLDDPRCESERMVPEEKEKLFTRTRSFGSEFNLRSDHRAPTRIVLLKPGPRRVYEYEDCLTTSSRTMEDSRGSIEDFLEEVKERLKRELQGKALKISSTVRGSGIETPFSERPLYDDNSNNILKKAVCAGAEDNVGRNNHLPRSESTRSYISEVQFNGSDSPEFLSRDMRKVLAERSKNVLKTNREYLEKPNALDTERSLKQTGEILDDNDQEDMKIRSFRGSNGYGEDGDVQFGNNDSAARSLIRSLSAPVSGTSFGKLLLEDRHVLTSAQIKRKQEAERVPSVDPTRRKERFNLKKKVSSFKSTLRGRIFGKKIRSMIQSNSFDDEYIKDFVIGSRFTNFYDKNENSTEVPPSPASVCSSTPEEFWRNVDCLSPVSTPDVTIVDENGVPHVFRDISSNLNELRRQINELESDLQEDMPIKQEANEPEAVDLANPDKHYVRDLLVASGLYDGTSDKSISSYDPFAKLISESVFQETEENHRKRTKQSSENNTVETETETDHNILFDLLNEALAVVLGPLARKSSCGRKLISSSIWTPMHGKRLLESVWQIMSEYLYARTDKPWCSLDGIIAWDLGNYPWAGLMDEEVNTLDQEVEALIMKDLIEDALKDLQLKSLPC